MGLDVKQEPIPGYYTAAQYDAVRGNFERQIKETEGLWLELEAVKKERDKLQHDLTKALFTKAEELAKQGNIAPDTSGEIRISDKKLRENLIFALMNKKIPVIILRSQGSQAVEVKY